MTNNQLFLALLASLITILSAFYKVLKDYIDARFESFTLRFDRIDEDLKFMLEHFADHEGRISRLEERTK